MMHASENSIPQRFRVPIQEQIGICALRRLGTGGIQLVLRMSGRVDFDRLSRAVRLTVDAEPILGCRFRLHWFRPTWERRADLDTIRLCQLVEPSNPDEAVNDFLVAAVDPTVDPLVRVLVVRGQTDTVCVKLSHMAGDGTGLKEYCRLLARTYRSLEQDPGYVPEPNVNGWRTVDRLWSRFSWRERLTMVRGMRRVLRERRKSGRWLFPVPAGGSPRRSCLMRRISKERTIAMRRFAEENGVSVNDLMMTAFFRSLSAVVPHSPEGTLPVATAMDLRQYLPLSVRKEAAICNLAGGLRLGLPLRPQASFADDLQLISETIKGLKGSFVGLEHLPFLVLFSMVAKLVPFAVIQAITNRMISKLTRGRTAGVALLTNIGAVSRRSLSFGHVEVREAYGTTGIVKVPGLAMILSTGIYEGAVLSIAFQENVLDPEVVAGVLQRMDEELHF